MGYHGKTLWQAHSEYFAVTHTEYAAGQLLEPHVHRSPYVSLLLNGRYTEVDTAGPRLHQGCTLIVHREDERHADFFHADGKLLNVEVRDGYDGRLKELEDILQRQGFTFASAVVTALHRAVSETRKAPTAYPGWLQRLLHSFDWTGDSYLADAAELCGLHPNHFIRAFKKHLGVTPRTFRMQRRVEAAAKSLSNSHDTLADVALATGFCDQSHLSKTFRDLAGMTPQQYRSVFAR